MTPTARDQTLPPGIPEHPVELDAHWIAKPGRESADGLSGSRSSGLPSLGLRR
jgi:hypothetical protein